jgi:hypothetical protein
MTNGIKKLDATSLEERLSSLEIRLSKTTDGRFVAYTLQEPLFCFECDTQKEIDGYITKALKLYAETFYEVANVEVGVTPVEPDRPLVPVEQLKPISSVRPIFPDTGEKVLAGAI